MLAARELTTEHIGRHVAYGPALMFSGTLIETHWVGKRWFKQRRGDDYLTEYDSPLRVFLRTQDGHCVTLAEHVPVYLREERA